MKKTDPRPYWDEKGNIVWLTHRPRWWKRSERHLYLAWTPSDGAKYRDR